MEKNKKDYIENIKKYIFYFIIFSIIGWLWEVLFHYIEVGEFVNRGMYHGPWTPIYGFGALFIIILFEKYKSTLKIFILSALTCGLIEYFTGWFIEFTRGYKWWDYSEYILNINGRVCLASICAFGLSGVILIKFLLPIIKKYYSKINSKKFTIFLILISLLYLFDIGFSIYKPNMGNGISKSIKDKINN